jgi:hypothetical protein
MKKILLASTILVGSAGIAAADNANFSFSGEAYAGVGYETLGGTFAPEVKSSFTVGMSTTSDMGLEAGATIKITAPGISWDSDHTDNTDFGTFSTDTSSISESSVYISGDWGKLAATYDADGSIDGPPDAWDVVFKYTNTWGDFGIEAYYTVAPVNVAGTNGDLGAKGTYSFGDYSVYAAFDWDASENAGAGDWSAKLGAKASMSGFTAEGFVEYDNAATNWDWKAMGSYTTGAFTVGAFAEDYNAADDLAYGANGSYALGGGISLDAAVTHQVDTNRTLVQAGVKMKF